VDNCYKFQIHEYTGTVATSLFCLPTSVSCFHRPLSNVLTHFLTHACTCSTMFHFCSRQSNSPLQINMGAGDGHGEGMGEGMGSALSRVGVALREARCKSALFCCILSPCYFDFPDCLGCSYTTGSLCCRYEAMAIKFFCGKVEQKWTCFLSPHDDSCCGTDCLTLCSGSYQELCMLGAFSIPPSDEVPCAVGLFGVFCYGGGKVGN
jgi:hypothetical protein